MIALEPISPAHAAQLQPLLEDPGVAATTPFPHPYPAGGALEYIHEALAFMEAGARQVFAVCDPAGQPIGVTLLKDIDRSIAEAELGYWIGRPYWGVGRATSAAQATVAFAFETLGLQALRAVCLEENPASLRVLAKLGFVPTGRLLWDLPKWPEPRPCLVTRLSRKDWPGTRAPGPGRLP
jgi:ribosomal-protein-alanine N-acetyltransferase